MKILNHKSKIPNLKIGIVCYPSIGGSGIVATNLGNELAGLGHQVHFISYDRPFRIGLKNKNIHYHRVKVNEYEVFRYPDYTLPLAEKIGMVNHDFGLDILHVHYAVPHATAALLAKNVAQSLRQRFPKVITTLHGTDITLLARDPNLDSIIKYSIEGSCGVTAVSESLKNDTKKILRISTPIEVIYNSYSPKSITKTRQAVRKSLRIKNEDFLAIHISNLRPVKRIPDLLKIIAKTGPNIKLLILAGSDFTPFLPLAKKLKIQNRIKVMPAVKDIQNYISAADVGLYTSEKESFGMGILETMVYKKPVIASRTGGVPEVVENKKTGFLVRVGDIKGFTKKIKQLASSPALVRKMGEVGFLRAEANFSNKKIISEYLGYYEKILKS